MRGLTAGATDDANVLAPPPDLSLAPANAQSERQASADSGHVPSSSDKMLSDLADALRSGSADIAQLRRLLEPAAPLDPDESAVLWRQLSSQATVPAEHPSAVATMAVLRAAWLCEQWQKSDGSDASLMALYAAARTLLVRLPLDRTANDDGHDGAHDDHDHPSETVPRPSRPELIAAELGKLAALDQLEAALRDAPLVATELPGNDVLVPPDYAPRPWWKFWSGPQTVDRIPRQIMQKDLAALSPEDRMLAAQLGGTNASDRVLAGHIARARAASQDVLAGLAPPHQRLIVHNGIIRLVADMEQHAHEMAAENAAMHGNLPQVPVRCSVRVRSIADFIRVEQALVEYRAGEIGHIENILQGEMKERLTRSLSRSETTTTETSEREETTERDTQTTNRFEVEKESEKALQETAEKHGEISASLSASYPSATVIVAGNLGFSSQTTKEETEKDVTRFSQNVTSRTLDRIKSRVESQRTSRMIREFEDTARHVLDNRGGADHVVGAYRWVDKIYSARAMNYGGRVVMEILVENPGRFLRPTAALSDLHLPPALDDVTHPVGPLKGPGDISRTNYAYFAGIYGADLPAPPLQSVFVTENESRDPDGQSIHNFAGEVEIPAGYKAVSYIAHGTWGNPKWGTATVQTNTGIFLGSSVGYFQQNSAASGPLAGYTGKLAYVINNWGHSPAFVLHVECQLTPEAFGAWQVDCHRRIHEAYENAVHAAMQAAAQEQARQGVSIPGRNPLFNDALVRDELKKEAIWAIGTGSPFWLDEGEWRVCDANGTTLPRLDAGSCAKLKIASLLESGIDWKLMVYQLLPYYWANVCEWQSLLGVSDPDPLYAEFLRSGAARILVPLANDKAAAMEILYYLHTGQRWTGDAAPPIMAGDEQLAAILESHALEENWPQPVGEPWTMRVPTSLTVLECGSACVDGDAVEAKLMPVGKKGMMTSGQVPLVE